MTEEFEYEAPAIVFPGQTAHETAYQTAHDLLARRFPKEALELIEPALAEDPKNHGLRSLRAWAYMIRAQLGKAEEDLRILVEDDPSDTWARHALGRVLERQSRLKEALPHLRLAAVMSDDYDHQAAVFRVQNRIAQQDEAE
jgi:Tfp pilus assembly protein PilF